MKTFLDLAQKRQSDRAYRDKPVEQEKLDRILEAARLAPSACNAQPWKLIIVTDPEIRHKVAEASSSKALSMNHFSRQAPVQIVLVEEEANFTSKFGGWLKQKHYPQLDLGIVASYICLAAADEGLGSCTLGWFNNEKLTQLLGIPKRKKVMLVILIGYSAQATRTKTRKPKEEICSLNAY